DYYCMIYMGSGIDVF
nr:immunoglobulin light chain junction region [Macaca mulatta]